MKKFSSFFFQSSNILVTILILIVFTAGSCHPKPTVKTNKKQWANSETTEGSPTKTARRVFFKTDNKEPGLVFTLKESTDHHSVEQLPVQSGTILDSKTVTHLLERAKETTVKSATNAAFALRKTTIPAPRNGEVIEVDYQKTSRKAPASKTKNSDVTVERFGPVGELDLAAQASVTFSKPMVSVSDLKTIEKKKVPVKISPQPKGEWRWLGSKTALFEPQKRMPMATHYRVSIPQGTKSVDGSTLKETVAFSFDTPPLKMKQHYPMGGPQNLETNIAIEFNQSVDGEALWPFIEITANGKNVASRLATGDERIQIDAETMGSAKNAKNRVVLIPERLPKASTIEIRIKKGAPSQEGPKKTTRVQSFDFFTYYPFEVTNTQCGYGDSCSPNESLYIEFNNGVDTETFQDAMVTVDPPIEKMNIEVIGNSLRIDGIKQGMTDYKVTISSKILDEFGQSLGQKRTVSFSTGRLEPTLIGPKGGMVTLSPFDSPKIVLQSMNHKKLSVTVHGVDASHFYDWVKWRHDRLRNENSNPLMPGTPLVQKILKPKANDRWQKSIIDFAHWLKKGVGHFAVLVRPLPVPKDPWKRQEVLFWVQVTKIGVSVFKEDASLLVWATTLKEGKPIAGVNFSLWPQKQFNAQSDDSGLGALQLPVDGSKFLVAKSGMDEAIVYPGSLDSMIWGNGVWKKNVQRNRLSCYATSDRGIYKPGETVRLKGWVRKINTAKAETISTIPKDLRPIKNIGWRLLGPRRDELAKGNVKTTKLGGFHLSVKLPKNMNLGAAEFELFSDNPKLDFLYQCKHHRIQVQEFKKPEFEVTASTDGRPHILGETAEASVFAKYFTGESLLGAPVAWNVTTSPAHYTPPHHMGFSFGVYQPYWRWWDVANGSATVKKFDGKTGVGGEHKLQIHFESLLSKEPTNVNFSATVTDVNRQQWTSSASMLVHPSARYVGIKPKENFVSANSNAALDVVVTDIDGNRTRGEKVTVDFYRLESKWKNGARKEVEVNVGTCTFRAHGEVHRCDFTPSEAGFYKWVAKTIDAEGRPAQSTMSIWVTGSGTPKFANLKKTEVRIIPKTDKCKPGTETTVLIQTPFYPAEGLVTLRKNGIRYQKRIAFDGPSKTVTIPISELEIPAVTVQVDITGVSSTDKQNGKGESEKTTPAFASGNIVLEVSPYEKRLHIDAAPTQKELAPGEASTILVKVTDSTGKPKANAEVALWVVDEAVLALTSFRLADPVELFYAKAQNGVSDIHSRSFILKQSDMDVLEVQSKTAMLEQRVQLLGYADGDARPRARTRSVAKPAPRRASSPKKSGGRGGSQTDPILVRNIFDALAYYEPSLKMDKNGETKVTFKLPHSLTKYRVIAVAADNLNRFGSSESTLVVRLPLMARPSAPRFLNYGDKFELPVVVQNRTSKSQEVDVAVAADNVVFGDSLESLTLDSGGRKKMGKKIIVPANNRVEVRFAATTQSAGMAHFKVVAASASSADSATIDLPVWTPATTEAFATYGSVEQGNVLQRIEAPKDVWTQFGGVTVTTSSTGLQSLTDAFIYLVEYPYNCSEQLASKVLAIATLKDVLFAFHAKDLPPKSKLEQVVQDTLRNLAGRQDWNGGFGLWHRGGRSWPYVNVHIANALAVAKQKEFSIDPNMWQRSIHYLNNIEHHIPSWYSASSKTALQAYAINVLYKMGNPKQAEVKAKALIQKVGFNKLSFEAKGWLLPAVKNSDVLRDKLLRDANNHVTQTAKNAHFVSHYSDGEYVLLHSDRRVDGIWLEALIEVEKSNTLIPKLMSGLLAHRKKGRWQSTQENAFVLSALDKYFHGFEQVTPDFVSRVWLGDMVSDGHRFNGRTTESALVKVDMADVPKKSNLVIEKQGQGRMYYRVGMNYAPKSLHLNAADYGFAVERRYQGVESDEDVWKDKNGVWHVKAGARVKVTIAMVATARRYHVALEDPLPAGFEAVNAALAVEQNVSDENASNQRTYWWWYRPWFEHQNLRDDKVEAFTSLLWDGVYTYSYEAKATTPGEYVVPPAKAMEMYEPETFGRSATDIVIVK